MYFELAPAFLLCFGVELFRRDLIHRPDKEITRKKKEKRERAREKQPNNFV